MGNIDAIQKIGEQERESREEDYRNSLSKMRGEYEAKLAGGAGGEGGGEDVRRLHEAHQAKLSQVEAEGRARIAELEAVSWRS